MNIIRNNRIGRYLIFSKYSKERNSHAGRWAYRGRDLPRCWLFSFRINYIGRGCPGTRFSHTRPGEFILFFIEFIGHLGCTPECATKLVSPVRENVVALVSRSTVVGGVPSVSRRVPPMRFFFLSLLYGTFCYSTYLSGCVLIGTILSFIHFPVVVTVYRIFNSVKTFEITLIIVSYLHVPILYSYDGTYATEFANRRTLVRPKRAAGQRSRKITEKCGRYNTRQ